jgi:predicted dehydrogenase
VRTQLADLADGSGRTKGRTRILLVGGGRRAQATILPAIHCMQPWVELAGVHTRTPREMNLLGGRLEIATRDDLAQADLSALDAIIVSVGIRQVPEVLHTLAPMDTRHLTLMLDTPIIHHRDLHAMRRFSQYRDVLACEDAFALPPFVLARRLIDEGKIGRLRYVQLFHSGYRFHALASLRQLTGSGPRSIRFTRWNPWCDSLTMRFPGRVKATIIEPRDYEVGKVLIAGEKGFITDYPIDHPNATRIGYRTEDGRYVGLTIDGQPTDQSERDTAFKEGLAGSDLMDQSLMNMLKIRGFMELLAALGDDNIPFRYPAADAIHDNIAIRVAQRTRLVRDVRLGRRSTLVGQAINVAAGVARLRNR